MSKAAQPGAAFCGERSGASPEQKAANALYSRFPFWAKLKKHSEIYSISIVLLVSLVVIF